MTIPCNETCNSRVHEVPIAIIGMAALFPQARNLQEYWDNIIGKVNCISDIPASHWNVGEYYDTNVRAPDKTYSKKGGFLPEIDFDPLEFGLPPDTLQALDSAQLLSLIVAKAALENAGYGKERDFNRETTGVILGASGLWKTITPLTARLQYPVWEKVLRSSGLSEEDTKKIIEKIKLAYVPWEENSFPGMLTNVVAGRITNRFDLGGTNCTVDAACASSLSALTMAISELMERRCDLVITGGVDTDNSILNYMCFSKTPALSKKDFLNPFDATSDGMMVGEGIGMLVLKRLSDAKRDNDRIYAVIKGIGTASDGRYKSIYAPRKEGQAKALHRAYQDANFDPSSVGLIEAHGTGTPAGDLCEFTALNQVFSENSDRKQHIALGSVKSQIGHTKAAAGAASLIKIALALHHKVLPPTINVDRPNPKFDIDNSPFYLNTETRPWFGEGDLPRRAGISSFGFGGTNFHVVLEEYTRKSDDGYRLQSVPQSVLLSAETPAKLLDECRSILSGWESPAGKEHYQATLDTCDKLVVSEGSARVGFVATSLAEAIELLKLTVRSIERQPEAEFWEHPRGIYYRAKGMGRSSKVVALFPGQGSQYLNMGREIALNFPAVRKTYEVLDKLFLQEDLTPISEVVFPHPVFNEELGTEREKILQNTQNAQPAIGAFSVGLYELLQKAGFKADFVAGHSFGELTALWAAGVLNRQDYFYLIKARGKAMSVPVCIDNECDGGTMLAVSGDVERIQGIIQKIGRVKIANFNSPKQIVLSGSRPELAAIERVLLKQGYTVNPLPVSAAFHSPFVSHASAPFAEAVESVNFQAPKLPVFANTTGEIYPQDPQEIKTILQEHMVNSVQFQAEIEKIYALGGYCFVEVGPRQILTNLVKEILGDRPHIAIALNANRSKNSDLQLRQAIVQLRVAGLALPHFDSHLNMPLPAEVPQNKRLKIRINGANYISDETKAAFSEALAEKNWLGLSEKTTSPSPALPIPCTPDPLPTSYSLRSEHQTVVETIMNTPEKETAFSLSQPSSGLIFGSSLESVLKLFLEHQSEVLHVHEKYLKIHAESPQSFLQMLQELYRLLGNGNSQTQFPLPREEKIVESQPEVAKIESDRSGANLEQSWFQALAESRSEEQNCVQTTTFSFSEANSPAVEQPSFAVRESDPPQEEIIYSEAVKTNLCTLPSSTDSPVTKALLEIVCKNTGYPAEMLEVEMDLEADLGVDSIKRVEIMGAMQELFPDLPKLSPDELGEQRSIADIAQYLSMQLIEAEKKIAV